MMRITLPPNLTIPATKSTGRKTDESFDLTVDWKNISRLDPIMTVETDEYSLRLRRAVENEDHELLWECLLGRFFGPAYHVQPSYRSLTADLVTVAAGIGLFLYHNWDKETGVLIRDAPRIFQQLEAGTIFAMAARADVSPGVVLAAAIQLGALKSSPTVRAALAQGDWDPFHEALWGPLLANFRTHPFFALYLKKMQKPDVRPLVGRPGAAVFSPPPVRAKRPAVEEPKGQGTAPAAPPSPPLVQPEPAVQPVPPVTPKRLFGKSRSDEGL